MIQTVLFDLDGTLLDREASVRQFVAAQYQHFAPHLRHISSQGYLTRWVELDCHGHVWKDRVYQQLVAEFEIDGVSWQQLLSDYEAQFRFHCVPFPGLREMLQQLKRQGYKMGVITNGRGTLQTCVVQGLNIEDYLDAVLISEVEGLRKPHPEIFHRAVQKLQTKAEKAVFVGDHPAADVRGAKGAGLKAVWKRNRRWPEPLEADAIIDDLDELPAVVARFSGR